MIRSHIRQSGFTIIELVGSLAVMAVVMLISVKIVNTTRVVQRGTTGVHQADRNPVQFLDRLRSDIWGAEEFRLGNPQTLAIWRIGRSGRPSNAESPDRMLISWRIDKKRGILIRHASQGTSEPQINQWRIDNLRFAFEQDGGRLILRPANHSPTRAVIPSDFHLFAHLINLQETR